MIKAHVHPQIKLLTVTVRVTQEHVFHPPNNYSIHLSWVSSSKVFHMPKGSVGYAQKQKGKNIHAKKHEKKCMPMSMKKKERKEKKEIR